MESKLPSNSRPVTQLTRDGIYLALYDSIYKAEAATGVHCRNIYKVCEGLRKTAGGFVWRDATAHDKIRRDNGI